MAGGPPKEPPKGTVHVPASTEHICTISHLIYATPPQHVPPHANMNPLTNLPTQHNTIKNMQGCDIDAIPTSLGAYYGHIGDILSYSFRFLQIPLMFLHVTFLSDVSEGPYENELFQQRKEFVPSLGT